MTLNRKKKRIQHLWQGKRQKDTTNTRNEGQKKRKTTLPFKSVKKRGKIPGGKKEKKLDTLGPKAKTRSRPRPVKTAPENDSLWQPLGKE